MNKSVTKIPCTVDQFFKYWLLFIHPLHKLPAREIDILALILSKRHELSKYIIDEAQIDKFLFSTEIRSEIINSNDISKNTFQVTLSALRKAGVILEDNTLNKRFVPDLSKDSPRFDLMILFDIQDNNAEQED